MHLEKLSKAAYENAVLKASIIAKGANMSLGKLLTIEKTCNKEIEGGIDISEANKLLGKHIGPVSSDPTMLPLKFNSKFTFAVQ
jgi:hypothetical protein